MFWDVLLDSFLDTVKLIPLLFLVYFLIELLEYKNVFKFEKSSLLKGRVSPAIGACIGCVPQCGFSVISAELFAEQKISAAALVAVFIATSDEAIPLMLADYHTIPALLMLIATKLVLAIAVGYLTYFLYGRLFNSKKPQVLVKTQNNDSKVYTTNLSAKETSISATADEHSKENEQLNHSHNNLHDEHDTHHEHGTHIHACCNHDVDTGKFNFAHPLIHCGKIALYIFVVNLIIGGIVALVGEENLMNFLSQSNLLQPLFALLVGLIPNCAASVVLTELYMMGGLSFGAIVTGLSVNAGIGLMVLLRKNRNIKQNIFIIVMLLVPSLIFGYALHFIPFDFLKI